MHLETALYGLNQIYEPYIWSIERKEHSGNEKRFEITRKTRTDLDSLSADGSEKSGVYLFEKNVTMANYKSGFHLLEDI